MQEESPIRWPSAFKISLGAILGVITQAVVVIIYIVQMGAAIDILKAQQVEQDRAIAILNTGFQRLIIVEERQNRVLETLRENAVTVRDNAGKLDQLQRSIDRWGPAQNPPGPGYKLQSVDPPR